MVAEDGDRGAAQARGLLHAGLEAAGKAAVALAQGPAGDVDRGTLGGQLERAAAPDAPGGACHDGGRSVECSHACMLR